MEKILRKSDWLPLTAEEVVARKWDFLDVIIISGDAYVDHPSFGTAVIGRVIEHEGYKVAVVPQPNWRDDLRDFRKLGAPRLFFAVTSGCMDSMVNHYTANRRLRSDDAYSPGGVAGFRPDYAVTEYCRILKQLFPDVPVVIGGIEASLRRLTHYDYWSDKLLPSVLIDSKADLLVYGMGEQVIKEILKQLKEGKSFQEINDIPQTAFLCDEKSIVKNIKGDVLELPSHEDCLKDKRIFAQMFVLTEKESVMLSQRTLIQKTANQVVVVNPAFLPPDELNADFPYSLPYTRLPHPKYKKRAVIPAWEMIKFSINTHRGCFGGCSFCAITAHQGKFVSSRSEKSIVNEAVKVSEMESFKGTITDLGGPSANMYRMHGDNIEECRKCRRPSCIYPGICSNLIYNHRPLLSLYKKISVLPGIKHVYVGSGIRHDMLVGRSSEEDSLFGLSDYLERLISKHVSGRFKVAPEHSSPSVLKSMRKPGFMNFRELAKKFREINQKHNLNMQIVPYLISGHPGCDIKDMAELAVEMRDLRLSPEQVQGFTPTPMTLSSVMYYCGFDPYTKVKLHNTKTYEEKKEQHRFFFWYLKENREQILKSLSKAGLANFKQKLVPAAKFNNRNKYRNN